MLIWNAVVGYHIWDVIPRISSCKEARHRYV